MNHPPTALTVLSTQDLIALATSAALDEIPNSEGSIKRHIVQRGLVVGGKVERPLLFVAYRTGRYGPQNGFRLVLVHRLFEPEGYNFAALEAEISHGTVEFVTLGTLGPAVRDPDPADTE